MHVEGKGDLQLFVELRLTDLCCLRTNQHDRVYHDCDYVARFGVFGIHYTPPL